MQIRIKEKSETKSYHLIYVNSCQTVCIQLKPDIPQYVWCISETKKLHTLFWLELESIPLNWWYRNHLWSISITLNPLMRRYNLTRIFNTFVLIIYFDFMCGIFISWRCFIRIFLQTGELLLRGLLVDPYLVTNNVPKKDLKKPLKP